MKNVLRKFFCFTESYTYTYTTSCLVYFLINKSINRAVEVGVILKKFPQENRKKQFLKTILLAVCQVNQSNADFRVDLQTCVVPACFTCFTS